MRYADLSVLFAWAALCLAGAALGGQASDAQSPQARFTSGTDLVQVDVAVVDKKRHPVHGLTTDDFELLVDGQPRPIEAFAEINLPGPTGTPAASWTRDVPPDVVTNQSVKREGRIVIIFMDRSIPVGEPTLTARRIAAAIVNELGADDLGAVVSSGQGGFQNLTADRERLLHAVNRSDLSTGVSPEAREIEERMLRMVSPENPLLSALNDGRCMCGVCVLDSVTGLADALENTSGRRKVLFFIGTSLQLQTGRVSTLGYVVGDGGCELALKTARESMFAALGRSNVTVYSLDPAGLVNISPATRASSTLRSREVQEALTNSTAEYLRNQNSLSVLPDLTGGRAIVNTNAPGDAVPGIFQESDSYYLLGFRASGDGGTSGRHTISVRVKRDDLRVHARSGYTVAPIAERRADDGLPESLRSALEPVVPLANVPLEVQAAAFAVPGTTRAAVMLIVGLEAAVNPAARSPQAPPFELIAFAVDPAGRSRAMARSTLELTLPGDTDIQQHVDVVSGFELTPGDYEVRVAGGDTARTGSVFAHVTVPSFRSEALSLSTILLGEMRSAQAQEKEMVAGLAFQIVPTSRREFHGQRRIMGFVRIYQGTGRTDALEPVTLRTFLLDGKGQTISSGSSVIAERQFSHDRASDHLVALPISGLAPGDYLLRVEATMGKRSAGRVVRFAVGRP